MEESKPLKLSLTFTFLASLLKIPPSELDLHMRQFSILPVKASGLALMDPTKTARESWISSTVLCGHIVSALKGREPFLRETHESIVRKAQMDFRSKNAKKAVDTATTWLSRIRDDKARIISRGMKTGAWLSAYPSEYNGTILSAQEWRDALCL